MPASIRPARPSSLHTDAGRPRSSHTGHQSPGLLEVEAQQAEHQANQVSLGALLAVGTQMSCLQSFAACQLAASPQSSCTAGHSSSKLKCISNVKHEKLLLLLQLRAQAKQCLIKHDFQQAEQLLSQGLHLTPGSYKLLRLRSVAYACLQKYEPSLKASALAVSCIVHHSCITCTQACVSIITP